MKLAQAADLLEQQGASPFRVSAYRRASETVSRLSQDIRELAEAEGNAGFNKTAEYRQGNCERNTGIADKRQLDPA